jgi:hypothetical protein
MMVPGVAVKLSIFQAQMSGREAGLQRQSILSV